jgi:disulfide bond formation protein DsbB
MLPEHAQADPPGRTGPARSLEVVALVLALVASAGSVWLSLGLGLKACPLCFYQRSFVFGAVGVLAMGFLTGVRPGLPSLLALPLGAAGLGVAVFHNYLELGEKLECPQGLAGLGTAPQQSLIATGLVVAFLIAGAAAGARSAPYGRGRNIVAALLIGVLAAALSIASAPPMPPAPAKPYETPFDMCRPPFRVPPS